MAKKDKKSANNIAETNSMPSSKGERTQFILAIIACIALPFIIYSNSLHAPFILDDYWRIVNNPDITSMKNIWGKLIYHYEKVDLKEIKFRNDPSRPVVSLTFALNYYFGKLNTYIYHFTNMAIHILNTILILWLSKAIIKYVFKLKNIFIPLVAALLFSIHPINFGTVAYIFNRSDLLATLFFVSSILFFDMAIHKNRGYFWISLISYILAIFSKQNSIVLPLIIFLYDYIIISNYDTGLIIKRKYFHILLWCTTLAYLAFRYFYFSGLGDLEAKDSFDRLIYLINQPLMILKYLKVLLYPTGLCLYHAMTPIPSVWNGKIIGSVFFIIIIIAVCVFNILKKQESYSKLFAFSMLWFFISLAPTSSIFPTANLFAENRLYLSGIGFYLVLTGIINYLYELMCEKPYIQRILILIPIGYIGTMVFVSTKRNDIYKNPILLWEEALSLYPINPIADANIVKLYLEKEDYDSAEKILKKAPVNSIAYKQLADLYYDRNKYDEAKKCYLKILEYNPNNVEVNNSIGVIYFKEHNYDMALKHYEKALIYDNNNASTCNNMGLLFLETGMMEKALILFEKAIEFNQKDPSPYYNLGLMYFELGDYHKALAVFTIAEEKGFERSTVQKKIVSCMKKITKK